MPDTCRAPAGCSLPPAVELTYQTAPVQARGQILPGMTWSEDLCARDAASRKAQILGEGGSIISEEALPPPPAPIEPAPVGLDAVDPTATPFRPDWAVHPGETLGELMDEQHLSSQVAAKALGWTVEQVEQVVAGTQDITLEMAGRLAFVFGPPIGFWLRLQEMYTQWQAEQQPAGRG